MRPLAFVRAAALSLLAATAGACSQLPLPAGLSPTSRRAAALEDTTVCVVDGEAKNGLRSIAAKRDPETGDLFVMRGSKPQPLSRFHPEDARGGYAKSEAWYRSGEAIQHRQRRFVKFGPERVVPAKALAQGPKYRGITLYRDARESGAASVYYVPLGPGCIFQPYVAEARLNASRR